MAKIDRGAVNYSRYLNGDDDGLVCLIRDYKDGLMLYLAGFTGDYSTAEDCVQETFIKIAIKRPHFKGKSSFKTWLYTIGRNVTLNHLRKEKFSDTLDEHEDLEDAADVEKHCLKEEEKTLLFDAMKQMKKDYYQVLFLNYFEGFTADEISGIMKKSKKQVENLLYNARKRLREILEREGFQYEEL